MIQKYFDTVQLIHYALVVVGLWLTYAIYNIFFGKYRNIPGPLISQLFPLYDLYFIIQGTLHLHLNKLHNKYGPIVRLGFNIISINDIEGWKKIHNSYKFKKSFVYNHMRTVGWSMITIDDRYLHAQRRRIVGKTFSEASTISLESTIRQSGVNVLVDKIRNTKLPIDMSKEFIFLSYDIIGKLLFSKSFNLLKGQNTYILHLMRNILYMLALNALFPPIRLIGNPYLRKMADIAEQSILERKQQMNNKEDVPKDLLNSLIEAKHPDTGESISHLDLMEECCELLVAGSDTTGSTLTWALYLILKHPEVKQKLVEEIETQFPDKQEKINYKMIIDKLPYFQNVLKEVSRLYAAASLALLRNTPNEGFIVQNTFIPGNTLVMTNIYAMHHSNIYWDQPEIFNPDRFNDTAKNNLDAYLPFSSGPRGCIGRSLANLEMSITLVELFRNFNMSLINEKDLIPICYFLLYPKGHESLSVSFEEK